MHRVIIGAMGVMSIVLFIAMPEAIAVNKKELDATPDTVTDSRQTQSPEPSAWTNLFLCHGFAFVSYNTPFNNWDLIGLALLQLDIQWATPTFGLQATTRLKTQQQSPHHWFNDAWFQQLYGFWQHGENQLKVGKIYQQFGRLWDYGFYGPLIVSDDLKIQPDLGVSAEGKPPLGANLSLQYAAQYFAIDGHSISFRNHPWLSHNTIRRKNIVNMRLAPIWQVNQNTHLAAGVSLQRFDALHVHRHSVFRTAIDIDANHGPLSAFAEWGKQDGSDVTFAGDLLSSYNYIWTGAMWQFSHINIRYHLNWVQYQNVPTKVDTLHQPGIGWNINEHFILMTEMAFWRSKVAEQITYPDQNLYVILLGQF